MSVVKINEGENRVAETDQDDVAQPVSQKEGLYALVKDRLAGSEAYDDPVQYELARWIHLLETRESDLKEIRGRSKPREVMEQLVRKAGAAIPSLLSAKPDLVFARTLRSQTEIALLKCNGWATRWLLAATGGSPVLTVFHGALSALAGGILVKAIWLLALHFQMSLGDLGPADPALPVVITGGFLGGLLSIVGRIQAFARLGDFEHMFLYLNACSRPFIGAVFGVFAYAVWQSGLLPLDLPTEDIGGHAVFAIAFIAGFSERFAKDLVSRGEGLVPASKTS